MKRDYKYQKLFNSMMKYVNSSTLACIVIIWVLVVISILIKGISLDLIRGPLILSFILVLELVLSNYYLKVYSSTKINITEESLRYVDYKKNIIIKYEDITSIKFSFISYLGGWMKIISKNDTIRLTWGFKNIQDLLLQLKTQLDKRDLSNTYELKSFFNFYKTVSYNSDSFKRMAVYFKPYILFELIGCMVVILIGIWASNNFITLMIPLTIFLPVSIFLLSEFIYLIKHNKQSDYNTFSVPNYDIVYEKKVNKFMAIILLTIYIPILIFVGIIFM